ncbi:hypothetical protein V5P93_003176 [Actinokineospora auranticolor]|uniref:Uncharacterized protein n=1 Tax=Actinokineospora auranticolor TaxID=155976 RepID=A0A2S6H1L1_9PSEU|nr:hypothetical protein [Actinokineospora auranticolor]PPK71310.1 hypothetical protein CLV40_101499 [Actinokineospora auranticolor]
MNTTRLGAWCGIAAGALIALPAAVETVTGETAATSFLLGLSPALAVPLLIALHQRQQAATGPFGATAFTLNTIGLGLFGGAAFMLNMGIFYLPEPTAKTLLQGPTMYALLGSALVFTVGTVLFGITMARAGVLPRVPSIAYTLALPALALAAPLPDTLLTSSFHIVSGAALVWLAVALTRSTAREGGRSAARS